MYKMSMKRLILTFLKKTRPKRHIPGPKSINKGSFCIETSFFFFYFIFLICGSPLGSSNALDKGLHL